MNSAAPGLPGDPVDDLIAEATAWYSARRLPLIVRITPAALYIDEALAERGFAKEGLTDVMTAAILPQEVGSEGAVTDGPGQRWLQAQADLQGVPPELRASWEGIIERITQPARFALVDHQGSPIAAGLAIRDGDWIGLFEINVAPSYRRRGVGRAVSASLLRWGAEIGTQRAYLQVVHDNEPAKALYRSLGFEPAYRYWYRRAPAF